VPRRADAQIALGSVVHALRAAQDRSALSSRAKLKAVSERIGRRGGEHIVERLRRKTPDFSMAFIGTPHTVRESDREELDVRYEFEQC